MPDLGGRQEEKRDQEQHTERTDPQGRLPAAHPLLPEYARTFPLFQANNPAPIPGPARLPRPGAKSNLLALDGPGLEQALEYCSNTNMQRRENINEFLFKFIFRLNISLLRT